MRVCARLSAVQRLKQKEVEDGAAQPNGDQKQTGRKRAGRTNNLVQPDSANFLLYGIKTARTMRTRRETVAEWQRRQQHGIVQASDFNWDQYLAVRGGTAALNGHLFQRQHFMERTLGQHIFRPGRSVRVQCTTQQNGGNGCWLVARIGVTLPSGQAVVEIPTRTAPEQPMVRNGRIFGTDSSDGVRAEIVQLDRVELAAKDNETNTNNRGTTEGTVDDDFRAILREHRDWLGRQLHTFIQEGDLFELQEAVPPYRSDPLKQNVSPDAATPSSTLNNNNVDNNNNFLRVHTVRIVGHQNGLMMVQKTGQGPWGPRRELVHITSERCHPLGWTRAQHPSDNYALINDDDFGLAVPRWIFTFRPLATHKFEVGMLLELLDPLNRLSFVPAYVSEHVNSHYFKVRPIRDVQSLDALLLAADHAVHCASPDIFPVGWCFKNQIRLTFPQGMTHTDASFYAALRLKLCHLFTQRYDNNSGSTVVADAFSTRAIQALCHEQSSQQQPSCSSSVPSNSSCCFGTTAPSGMEFSFAPDSLFDLPKMVQKRLECVRYCEVQDADDPSLFCPGAIVRSHQHLLWVHVDRDEHTHRPAQIYTLYSPQLFRCGTAKRAASSKAFTAAAALRYFVVPIRIPTPLNGNCGRVLVRTYTSQRTPVFLPRQKHFLSDMWLKADLWLPAIHLNAQCFCGPFLVADKVRALPARYAPSPLPHAIGTLVKDLLACGGGGVGGTRGVRELADLVGADRSSRVPLQMLIKLKYANRRVRFSVEVCERAAQFPGWLRTLLVRLDACPNLLSLEKRDQCPLNCSTGFASSPYLSSSGHANTASQQSSQQQTNKLNQAAQQLKKVVQQQKQRKKRNYGWSKKAKKEEGEEEEEEEGEEQEEEEYALRQQPMPSRREPSKRLSIAQPVVDDDFDDDGEEEGEQQNAEVAEDGIIEGEKRRRRKRSSKKNERKEIGTTVANDNHNDGDDDDEDDDNSRNVSTSSSTATSNSSSVSSSQQRTKPVVDEPNNKRVRRQQQRKRRSSSSSSSTDMDGSSSLSSSSCSTTASFPSSSVAKPHTQPSRPLSRPAENEEGQWHQCRSSRPSLHGRGGTAKQQHDHQQPTTMVQQHQQQQQEMKRERQVNNPEEGEEAQWRADNQQQLNPTIQSGSNQQQPQHKNIGHPAQNAGMPQQYHHHHPHYTAPVSIYAPYLYSAAPPQQYGYFYASVAAPPPSAAALSFPPSSSSASSAAPSFFPQPPPSHVHLMPAPPPPPPPAMFAPLPLPTPTTAAGTSAGFVCPHVDSNPAHWSAEALCRWLTEAGFADCAQRLLNEEVDGASLLLFSPVHYQNLGLKLGPMVKLQQVVEYLRQFTLADARASKQ